MPFSGLTVRLKDGSVFYFNAGPVLGDSQLRIDLLRDAVDNGSFFTSVDTAGTQRRFHGDDVANYHLG
ncbi:hypothetical protein G7Y31_00160 [Corynebacterium lizhenjunii]|uniref:Uncharacterized protein n=1 Tax=Corynebacterium lizhenjunii TaxID=2709394 RepID=A0A7T0KEM0_9CORY|nr:hypothetical protein [Corynebacterium lizhenjunii]QPK79192.1 hypothetical protein G7Y31_00160 [Corynebacterium lizhenjunii]